MDKEEYLNQLSAYCDRIFASTSSINNEHEDFAISGLCMNDMERANIQTIFAPKLSSRLNIADEIR
jgi:hypothetical protein